MLNETNECGKGKCNERKRMGSSYRLNDAIKMPCVRKVTICGPEKESKRKKWRPLEQQDAKQQRAPGQRIIHGPGTVNSNGWGSKLDEVAM